MKRQTQRISTDRRKFLRGTFTTGTAAALAATLPPATIAEPVKQGRPGAPESGAKGYQITQHVMDYYRSARS